MFIVKSLMSMFIKIYVEFIYLYEYLVRRI